MCIYIIFQNSLVQTIKSDILIKKEIVKNTMIDILKNTDLNTIDILKACERKIISPILL